MLNPIDTAAVIREGGAIGRFPGDLHEGVGWWLGACLVVNQKATRLALAHNGHPAAVRFAGPALSGAINAEHYACLVRDLGHQTEEALQRVLATEQTPGIYLAADGDPAHCHIRITLYDRDAAPLREETGLAEIRRRIAEDRVPIPVNAKAKGRIVTAPAEPRQGDAP
jgi:hypothetical protein